MLHAWRVTVVDVGFQDLKSICDDEVCLAFPLGAVGCAAPSMGVGSSFEMLVESKVVQTKIDPSAGTEVEFDCGQNHYGLVKRRVFERQMVLHDIKKKTFLLSDW